MKNTNLFTLIPNSTEIRTTKNYTEAEHIPITSQQNDITRMGTTSQYAISEYCNYTLEHSCYAVFTGKYNYEDSKKQCVMTGMHLLVLETWKEWVFIARNIVGSGNILNMFTN